MLTEQRVALADIDATAEGLAELQKRIDVSTAMRYLEMARVEFLNGYLQIVSQMLERGDVTYADIGVTREDLTILKRNIYARHARRALHDAREQLNANALAYVSRMLEDQRVTLADIDATAEDLTELKKKISVNTALRHLDRIRAKLDCRSMMKVLAMLKQGEVTHEELNTNRQHIASLVKKINVRTARWLLKQSRKWPDGPYLRRLWMMLVRGVVTQEELGVTTEAIAELKKNIVPGH